MRRWRAMLAVAALATVSAQDVPDDRRLMLDRLGIAETRPGADGSGKPGPNAVNYDEAKAGPIAPLPDPLTSFAGRPVERARDWWRVRRPEIAAAFDTEIYGRVPAMAPRIAWRVTREERGTEGAVPVVRRWLDGVADNRAYPAATATLKLRVTLPAAARRLPLMLSFGFPEGFRFPGPPPPGPTATEQLVARGWGHAVLVASSVQADAGEGLRDGVIGIAARGKLRDPADWGVLRAWAWGASRALDPLAAMAEVDARRIGIEGLSRYGKAALVALAYEPRFAIGLIGSSGAGGAKPFRRDYGERVGNLASGAEHHWFAGNFLRYASVRTETDLPVDQHMLIALAAPRPIFIGAGNFQADAWVDPRGSFLAADAAGPVYRLLGATPLSSSRYPAIGEGVTGGTIAFRQHAGGHTNLPNWQAFLDFAEARLRP